MFLDSYSSMLQLSDVSFFKYLVSSQWKKIVQCVQSNCQAIMLFKIFQKVLS